MRCAHRHARGFLKGVRECVCQETRVGFHVNQVRKEFLRKWPNVQKQSRDLIKEWQDYVNTEKLRATPSAGSSANCTPGLISPSVARLRKTTPNTPYNKRVTSTGLLNGTTSGTVSPANGSYAPKTVASPSALANGMHKSFSVGGELSSSIDDLRNGKRKTAEEAGTLAKKSRTSSSLASPALNTPGSVLAARKNAQSTSELVAQLSQNLPDHMNIDSSIREHEERVKREQHDEEVAMQISMAASNPAPVERKKRKYERKQKPVVQTQQVSPPEERRGGLVIRLPRIPEGYMKSEETVKEDDEVLPTTSSSKGIRKDWRDILPSLEELRIKSETKTGKSFDELAEQTRKNPTKVRHINNEKRMVFMLPYLDNPSGPDFIKYSYPRSSQYYAEQNFFYGAPRPKD